MAAKCELNLDYVNPRLKCSIELRIFIYKGIEFALKLTSSYQNYTSIQFAPHIPPNILTTFSYVYPIFTMGSERSHYIVEMRGDW